jgi:hypothetical protein
MYWWLWLIYTWCDCNEWKREKRHECTNMGKVKRLELWWQLYVTSLPERVVRNIRPLDFCWTEGTINFVWWPETMAAWIYSDLSCPVAERKIFLVELSWVINRGASIWSANKISKHEIENMTVNENKKRHRPLAQLKIMFFFFLTQGHY